MRIRPDESYDEYAARMARKSPSSNEEKYQRMVEKAKKNGEKIPERDFRTTMDKIKERINFEKEVYDLDPGLYLTSKLTMVMIVVFSVFSAILFIAWFVMLVQNPGVGSKTTDELRRERWEYEMEQDRIENQRIQEERAYKDLKSMTE